MHGTKIKIIIMALMQKTLTHLHQKLVCAPNSSL